MEAGTLIRPTPLKSSPLSQQRPLPHPPTPGYHSSNSISIPRSANPVKASSSLNSQHFQVFFFKSSNKICNIFECNGLRDYQGPKPKREWVADWVSQNDDVVRSLPIYVGGLSLIAVLVNLTISGIAPAADASSSQSRADLLTLGLAVTNILNGLVWLSIRPKSVSAVNPEGAECQSICPLLPDFISSELLWVWESLSDVTCCRSLIIVYDRRVILQIGFATALSSTHDAAVVEVDKLVKGSLYQGALKSKSQSYLANLSLYPAKSELPFLPPNTQAIILQPLGDKGLAIIGGDVIRGFTTSDQAWITLVGEKLDATLAKMNNIPVNA